MKIVDILTFYALHIKWADTTFTSPQTFNMCRSFRRSNSCHLFPSQGIPFAEPPVRFSPPVTKQSWQGEWNATYFRPACVQPGDFYKFWFKPEMSEDCLYLNVYSPHPKVRNNCRSQECRLDCRGYVLKRSLLKKIFSLSQNTPVGLFMSFKGVLASLTQHIL